MKILLVRPKNGRKSSQQLLSLIQVNQWVKNKKKKEERKKTLWPLTKRQTVMALPILYAYVPNAIAPVLNGFIGNFSFYLITCEQNF